MVPGVKQVDIRLSGSEDEIVKVVLNKAALNISARYIKRMYHKRKQQYSSKILVQIVMRRVRRMMYQSVSNSPGFGESLSVGNADGPVTEH